MCPLNIFLLFGENAPSTPSIFLQIRENFTPRSLNKPSEGQFFSYLEKNWPFRVFHSLIWRKFLLDFRKIAYTFVLSFVPAQVI